jgi:hypothetical protein
MEVGFSGRDDKVMLLRGLIKCCLAVLTTHRSRCAGKMEI